jgi:hypothetical protein
MINLVIGYVGGILTMFVLSCCIISGDESRKEENDELTRK